ncbi:MAG: hypothetical protein B7Y26_13395 [Hydrogenophilales bacterium 16-64-46]|nr:MAG: hypothetical protein B7Z32_12945 [Hydrogenophilales bacterium 12-64-13]OYZ04121.1 MAG: hypothetical protein B7Y26_13395 [Hydrogenophilales bacterium 16-64-46]OZA36869.1 MAG: hypothetical protein B7X87_12950 [Hydrogenophilales bacterium 17-64-34]HQT00016.1 hypothetical protein [Thiobacillus sp.]
MLRVVVLSKTRRQRDSDQAPRGLDSLPDDRRQLLKRWIKRGGDSRWDTLRNDAGVGGQNLAQALLDWLLDNGWIQLDEKFERAAWWPYRVRFREPASLRAALGIVDADAAAAQWQAVRATLPPDTPLLDALDTLPPKAALARVGLATKLAQWQHEQRSGTERDFALFARNATKAISTAEWTWLGEATDLAEWGIERHTPLLLITAPITLQLPHAVLNLAACADFCALTPATLAAATTADGAPTRWQLVENRTSFERVARNREANAGVIWLPGFPPGWWRAAVAHLLALAPAPAAIACDPDPAGVAIALQAGALWQTAGLDWQPWHMDIATLQSLAGHGALNAWDSARIAQLRQTPDLPAPFAALLDYMQQHNIKGEQEGAL